MQVPAIHSMVDVEDMVGTQQTIDFLVKRFPPECDSIQVHGILLKCLCHDLLQSFRGFDWKPIDRDLKAMLPKELSYLLGLTDEIPHLS